ncbi:GNAT family N-acetyltransferase, partial [Vibrio splendidus]
ALETQLLAIGINQIKLRVAYHNERALKLYKEVGFEVTGFNMSKKLSG